MKTPEEIARDVYENGLVWTNRHAPLHSEDGKADVAAIAAAIREAEARGAAAEREHCLAAVEYALRVGESKSHACDIIERLVRSGETPPPFADGEL